MSKRERWSRIFGIAGFIALLLGVIDPLEGCAVILLGSGLSALGAFLAKSRHKRFIAWAFAMTAVGVAAVIIVSMLGGVGGSTGRSPWWLLTAVPYPIGWIMSLIGGVRMLIQSLRHSSAA